MVLTRRGSRSVNSLDVDSFVSASAGGSARRGEAPPPPPRAPPPPPPPVHLPRQPSGGAPENHGGDMAPIPEEVAMNNSNNDNNSGESSEVSVAVQNNVQHVPPPPAQYLNVRTPASPLRPSRVHRRHHHHRAPDSNPASSDLQTRSRRGKAGSSMRRQSSDDEGEIVRVLIPRNGFASERQLAECLSQAGAADVSTHDTGGWNGDGEDDDFSMDEFFDEPSHRVAGMFTERDRVFVPLSIIYSNPTSFTNEVLSLTRPPPKRRVQQPATGSTPKRRSIFITFLELLGIVVVAAASWWTYGAAQLVDWEHVLEETAYKIERCLFAVLNFPFWLFDALIEFPLREIYRHGPSVLGWEGEPLPRICARITYHGDESFWSRNLEECEQIYKARETAAMQVRKPLVIGFLIFALFYMAKSIVAARALRRRERIDPNMVETYRAIQMLTRQLRRAVNSR